MKTQLMTGILVCMGASLVFAESAQSVLTDIHKANLMEIRMGKIAEEKGQSADMRSYGETLVKNHEEADQKVKDLADKQGITLEPTGKVTKEVHKMEMSHWASKNPASFDKDFADQMVKDHQKTIADLQKAQASLPGTPTAELIGQLLPTLQQHLETAEKLSARS
jgi:putative membrane protein